MWEECQCQVEKKIVPMCLTESLCFSPMERRLSPIDLGRHALLVGVPHPHVALIERA